MITPNKSSFSSLIARAKTRDSLPEVLEMITSEKLIIRFSLYFNFLKYSLSDRLIALFNKVDEYIIFPFEST